VCFQKFSRSFVGNNEILLFYLTVATYHHINLFVQACVLQIRIARSYKFKMVSFHLSKKTTLKAALLAITGLSLGFGALPVSAKSLVITNRPLPENLQRDIYQPRPVAPIISPQQLLLPQDARYDSLVNQEIAQLRNELSSLQSRVSAISGRLATLQGSGQQTAAAYYANIGTISTQLQTGTTPGNPRLLQQLDQAQANLETLSRNLVDYNGLAVDTSEVASTASYLINEARAAYSLTGALEEDHATLAAIEDSINNITIVIDRLQNNVNDDISRTAAYLAAEQNNLRTLSLAVANGDFYGKALSSRPFSRAPETQLVQQVASSSPAAAPSVGNPKPLVKIRFDKANVNFEEPVYTAVSEAIAQYPNAQFDLVAVEPTVGNAAQLAIESTRARRNAEKVFRTLTQQGIDQNRIDLATSKSPSAKTSEVHIYIR